MAKKRKSRASEDEDEKDQEIGDSGGSIEKEKSLYEILGVEKTATKQEIKKAYHKLALQLHPDKNPGDDEAKEKFQLLQKVISILGDEEKRSLYDQTGCVDDEALCGEAAGNLQELFRAMFTRITEADIEEFEANYRGSDSEKKDLKDLYIKFKGNMKRIICSMFFSKPKIDSHRFKDIIDEAIAEGELKTTKAYQKWAKQIAAIKPPTDPLARRPKSRKKEEENDLVALITQRRSQRKEKFDSILATVIAHAGGDAASEPTDEEFEKARARLEGRMKQSKRQKKH